jgi:hypothetical protein
MLSWNDTGINDAGYKAALTQRPCLVIGDEDIAAII